MHAYGALEKQQERERAREREREIFRNFKSRSWWRVLDTTLCVKIVGDL